MTVESNPILDFATHYQFPAFSEQRGVDKIVAFGDQSHKCPVYIRQVPPPCLHKTGTAMYGRMSGR